MTIYTFHEDIIIKGLEIKTNEPEEIIKALVEATKTMEKETNADYRLNVSEKDLLKEWFQGICYVFIPFFDDDILKAAEEYGLIFISDEEKRSFLDDYYEDIAKAFIRLRDNL